MWTEKSGRKTRLCTTYVDPLTGSRHKIGVTIEKDTPQQRNRAKEELDALVARKTSVVPVSMSFKKLTELYKTDQALTLKKSTCTRNEYACKAFRKMFGDDCDVSKLTAGIVKQRMIEYRDKKAAAIKDDERREKAEKSVTMINEHITRFKALMRWAYQNDYIADISYLDKLKKLKDRTKREKVADKFLEADQCEILINALPERWQTLTRFMLLSGMRVGEVLALNESDLHMDTREIIVNKTLDVVNGIVTDTKTLSSTRTVYMQNDLYALCASLIASNKKKRKILYISHAPLYFTPTGAYECYGAYNKTLREVSERVLGKRVTTHTLRHTHASLLAEAGLPYDTIARRLGHGDSRITKEIYIHITEKRKERENELIRDVQILNFA